MLACSVNSAALSKAIEHERTGCYSVKHFSNQLAMISRKRVEPLYFRFLALHQSGDRSPMPALSE